MFCYSFQGFLESVDTNDTKVMNILNRNSRFSVQVPDKFLAHNCTPAWRLIHSHKTFRPTTVQSLPTKNKHLRRRIKITRGVNVAEPDPISFTVGLLHHDLVEKSAAEDFDPVCHLSKPLATCPNTDRHHKLLESCPLPLACPSCWSAQRRETTQNAFGQYYKILQKNWIERGNTGSYLDYRLLHRYSKLWRKSINAGTAEFRKMIKSLEEEEKKKMGERINKENTNIRNEISPPQDHPDEKKEESDEKGQDIRQINKELDGCEIDVCTADKQEDEKEELSCPGLERLRGRLGRRNTTMRLIHVAAMERRRKMIGHRVLRASTLC